MKEEIIIIKTKEDFKNKVIKFTKEDLTEETMAIMLNKFKNLDFEVEKHINVDMFEQYKFPLYLAEFCGKIYIKKELAVIGHHKILVEDFLREEEIEEETEEQIQGGFTPEMIKCLVKDMKKITSEDILKEIEEMVKRELGKQKKNFWSTDGICLMTPIAFWGAEGSNPVMYNFKPLKEEEKYAFASEKRAKLEIEIDEVDYLMKKHACISRSDNSWKIDCECENYYIKFDSDNFYIETELFAHKNKPYVAFNQAYFNTEEDAQKCLDFLLEKYTEQRLKKIWGVK